MKTRVLIKRIAVYFLLTFAAFLMETSVLPLFTFLAAAPHLMLIVVFTYGYIYGSTTGIVCGIFAGFLMDIFYNGLFGLNILIYSYLGFFSGMFHFELSNDSVIMPVVLCLIADLGYNLCMMLITFLTLGTVDIGRSFTAIILPETFFTLLVTVFIYRVFLKAMRAMDSKDDIRGSLVA